MLQVKPSQAIGYQYSRTTVKHSEAEIGSCGIGARMAILPKQGSH